ncbi:GGDEF domain-containing protein [Undibacterium sp.]|uniref:GGDEF domain-containing protein n=1 Tax=Undibacterium sp. TaxID=1914977 RepID=UPI002CF2E505|nr:GGDEF domain-containing protein [Undibacterium sp.]HTD04128.1 GGDEF domain-containing protein [Undibacterium sp.]
MSFIDFGIPRQVVVAINNSLTLTTLSLMLEGTLRFRGYLSATRWRWGALLIPVFILMAFVNRDDAIHRYLFHDTVAMLFTAGMAVAFLRRSRQLEILTHGIAAFFLLALTAGFGGRWLLAYHATSQQQLLLEPFMGTLSLIGILFTMGWTFSTSTACNLRAQKIILGMAREDTLTGLPNRRHFDEVMRRYAAQSARGEIGFGFILVDLNDFKQVNDHYGHQTGDALLVEAAKRLRKFSRDADFVGRIGGDEFVVLTYGIRDQQQLDSTLQRLRLTLNGPATIGRAVLDINTSLGAARWPIDGRTPDKLMHAADQRMYADKSAQKAARPAPWPELVSAPAPGPDPDEPDDPVHAGTDSTESGPVFRQN